jgi:site-specific DNA-cytosine methylase
MKLAAHLITASIPCQPFSFAGLDLDNRDTRDLSSSIADLLHNIFPPILIIGNVHRYLKSNAFTLLRTNAIQHGYKVLATSVDILRWVPLSRARCAVFLIREDIFQDCNWFNKNDPFIYPTPTSPKPTIANSPSISKDPHPEDIISGEEISAYSIYVRNRTWPDRQTRILNDLDTIPYFLSSYRRAHTHPNHSLPLHGHFRYHKGDRY